MKKKHAFSLIEISIVVLIVGLLIAGTTQATRMIKKSRLTTAQSLTALSPVNAIEGLDSWYETSLESSFLASEAVDDNKISVWHDNNPKFITKKNATQSDTAAQPKFYSGVFNNAIPSIRFNGTSAFLLFDGTNLINSAYSIFIVEQKKEASATNVSGTNTLIGGSSANDAGTGTLTLRYNLNTTISQNHYDNGVLTYTTPDYASQTPRMHIFTFDSTQGKRYWLNSLGKATPTASESSQTGVILKFDNSAIGRGGFAGFLNYFDGDIAEIIIFTRTLKTEERALVAQYLGKKFNIKLTD